MGRATRWLKGLFGIKVKDKERNGYSGEGKGKGHWSSGHSGRDAAGFCHNPATIPPNITPAEAAWLKSFYSESTDDSDQNKHAIAVAAATAAAADAAVAAAQAAVAVVRLTSKGRGTTMIGWSREKWAAVKIQTVFRGYLARKALRALKGLVKIQALVKGFLVRKQAAATLHSMQALIRAQASVRAQKIQRRIDNEESFPPPRTSLEKKYEDARNHNHPPSLHSRRLSASFEPAMNSFDESPKIVEVDTGCRPKSRSRRAHSWMAPPDSGEDSFGKALSAPYPCKTPLRPESRNFPDQEWVYTAVDECHFSTAQSTPRFTTTSSCGCSNTPVTPAKSACTEGYFRSFDPDQYPNYMAKTQSFKAKLRSQSAPKQRPESGPRRKLSLHEMMESRNSLSGVRMQKSCSQAQEAISFKNAVMGKLGRSSDFVRENNFYPN